MSGTPTSTRQPPVRHFENYVLTRLVDPSAGLTDISTSQFTQLSGSADYTGFNIGEGFCDDGFSSVYPIGFNFELDGITYTQFVANANGWMVLVDPVSGTFNPAEVLGNPSEPWVNPSIKPTFSSDAVLLAPWFDDLRNVADTPAQLLASPISYSINKARHVEAGIEPRPSQLDQVAYGVSYFNDVRSTKGRRLIIRWNSLSNYQLPSTILKFEVVLYENGTIEYRYAPRTGLTLAGAFQTVGGFTGPIEGATIGVFMPNGTNRFRDFAVGLGYRDDARQQYVYGGYAYTPGYLDSEVPSQEDYPASASYTINLQPFRYWPGLNTGGSVFTFSPPVNRRKVLPRKAVRAQDARLSFPTVARTGDDRLGTAASYFDDRRSVSFAVSGSAASTLVNYPTTLPRFFGDTGPGAAQRQDLFSGDVLVTGSIVRSAIDQFIIDDSLGAGLAFNESRRHDQDPLTLTSAFYSTGSAVSSVGAGFDQALKSKTQVRFQLPVDVTVHMPGSTSSIYYYNARTHGWEVPSNSSYILATDGTSPPAGAGGDWADPTVDASNGRIIEDPRGFGPIGNVVSSGSHHPSSTGDQTDALIGAPYDSVNSTVAISRQYANSVRTSDRYAATVDESFTLPINAPFLIEKMVIELPLQMGAGWFADMTQAFQPLDTDSTESFHPFDFAGPALTVALSRQVQLSENSPTPSRRDLILTGTIIPTGDNTSQIVVSSFSPYDSTYQVRPVGFLAYAGPAGAVVTPNMGTNFTGSVAVQCQALSAVGNVLKVQQIGLTGAQAQALINQSGNLLLSQCTSSIAYVSPLGRGGTGFQQSGRSALGNEYVTLQGLDDQSGRSAPNPFYVGPAGVSAQAAAAFNGGGSFNAVAALPMVSHFPSPYLVMPGDRLVISVSKMRPFIFNGTVGAPTISGSIHDVNLGLGTINVTLYGSQVQAGVEYHDTLNQPLASDGVHELIGADPVLDQFEPAYSNEYSGSFTDNVVLGDMLETLFLGGQLEFVQGVRSRKLSKLNSRNVLPLTTSPADLLLNPYKGYRTQQWYERAGNVRTSQFFDVTERFYDSMMPSVADCFAADGCGIFIAQPGSFGDYRQVNVGTSGSANNSPTVGWIWFDYNRPDFLAGIFKPLINTNWTKAFPYEPRYQNALRQGDISKSFIATFLANSVDGNIIEVVPIDPTPVSGFFFGPRGSDGYAVSNTDRGIEYFFGDGNNWFGDVNLVGGPQLGPPPPGGGVTTSSYYVTGSCSVDDISRGIFGFGDVNDAELFINDDFITFSLLGSTHFAGSRDCDGPHPDNTPGSSFDQSVFRFSPLIRGWKYGVYSGIPAYSSCQWRRGKFGQFRDMLEQRAYSKYYQSADNGPVDPNFQAGMQAAVVNVTFLAPDGTLTDPASTFSSNLSFECTSSLPFFEGNSTNRPPINPLLLNKNILNLIPELQPTRQTLTPGGSFTTTSTAVSRNIGRGTL